MMENLRLIWWFGSSVWGLLLFGWVLRFYLRMRMIILWWFSFGWISWFIFWVFGFFRGICWIVFIVYRVLLILIGRLCVRIWRREFNVVCGNYRRGKGLGFRLFCILGFLCWVEVMMLRWWGRGRIMRCWDCWRRVWMRLWCGFWSWLIFECEICLRCLLFLNWVLFWGWY